MDGSAELLQLAGLLRVGADTSRKIARARGRDEASIERLACQAEAMADELEMIVRRGAGDLAEIGPAN